MTFGMQWDGTDSSKAIVPQGFVYSTKEGKGFCGIALDAFCVNIIILNKI